MCFIFSNSKAKDSEYDKFSNKMQEWCQLIRKNCRIIMNDYYQELKPQEKTKIDKWVIFEITCDFRRNRYGFVFFWDL